MLAFGSCRKQNRPQPVMDAIVRLRADAWIWTGDYLYFKPNRTEDRLRELESAYAAAVASHGERVLREAVPIIDGVYDDHDYGENDAGASYPAREHARRLFLDWVVRAPSDSPRRSQPGGLYGVRTFGEPPHQVKLLMLDTRYARGEPAVPSVGAVSWLPSAGNFAGLVRALCALVGLGSSEDMLGSEAQWSWLESELIDSQAAVHLLVSSVQVLTTAPPVESWGHFPQSRRRLLSLLATHAPRGALLLSGDVHYAELLGLGESLLARSREPNRAAEGEHGLGERVLSSRGSAESTAHGLPVVPAGAELLEVTSSGLTHSCGDKPVGWLACHTMRLLFSAHRIHDAAKRPPYGSILPAVNFGSLVAHFEGEEHAAAEHRSAEDMKAVPPTGASASAPHVLVRIHDVDGAPAMEHRLPLGLTREQEAARWQHALEMPSIFDGPAILQLPIIIGLIVVALLGVRACRRARPSIRPRQVYQAKTHSA